MLPADAAIAARDPALPALRSVLDDAALGDHLRAHWSAGHPAPEQVRVTYLRYKPGTSLLAAVEVVADGHRTTRLLAATSMSAVAKLDKLRAFAARQGIPVLAAAEQESLLVLPIEGDRHLVGCHRLAERVGRLDRDLRGGRLAVLAYKPHRRLVGRVEVEGVPSAVVKVHQPKAFVDIAAGLRWASSGAAARLPLPRLLGVDGRRGIALTGWAPGVALDEQEPERRRATLRGVGKVLGRLHRLDPAGLVARSEVGPDAVVTAIARLRPDLAAAARAALHRPRGAVGPRTPVHGDLSRDQVIHGPGGVALIDIDRAGVGAPGADLASWLAAEWVAAPGSGTGDPLPEELLEGYRSVDGPASDDDIADHLPEQLLRRATEPFRLRQQGWDTTMEAVVARARALTETAGVA